MLLVATIISLRVNLYACRQHSRHITDLENQVTYFDEQISRRTARKRNVCLFDYIDIARLPKGQCFDDVGEGHGVLG